MNLVVYLIAPARRIHPSTDIPERYLAHDVEIIRASLSESWRSGLCVMFRQ